MTTKEEIISHWHHLDWAGKLKGVIGQSVTLLEENIECLKNSRERSSIWKIAIAAGNETIPIVVKILKLPLRESHQLELNMYQKAAAIFQEFMPRLYWIEPNVNNEEIWLFMECLEPLRGQLKITPEILEQFMPTLAKFHSLTMGERFLQHSEYFDSTLPHFDSDSKIAERNHGIKKAKEYLELAMKDDKLKELLKPRYKTIKKILKKGPVYFPEILSEGQCVIHGDLHFQNVCGKNLKDADNRKIYLIDWESAKYFPCWYDLVVLVEMSIDFRGDWHKREDEIRKKCVHLYCQEMEKYGITFNEDPIILLKKAYLQRTIDKRLSNHLRKELEGEKSPLLKRYLEKIEIWGKELGLY